MSQDPKSAVIILAAGSASRMQSDVNKVYLRVLDQELLTYPLNAIAHHPLVGHVVVVVRPSDEQAARSIASALPETVRCRIVLGGDSRQESEWRGIHAIAEEINAGEIDVVAVHDGARPFVSEALISRVLEAAANVGGAIPGTAIDELLFDTSTQQVVDSNNYIWCQTPQGFNANVLLRAHEAARDAGFQAVDTAEIVSSFSDQVISVVAADRRNIKVTFPADLVVAEAYLRSQADS